MSDRQLPKLSLLGISIYVADLLLVSEGSTEAVKEPRTRFVWHLLFFSFIAVIVIQLTWPTLTGFWPEATRMQALLWRWFHIVAWSWLLIVIGLLAYRHYRFLMLTKKDLRFQNVAFFFVAGHLLFGHLYEATYMLSPALFEYNDAIFVPGDTLRALSFSERRMVSLDFFLYSLCTATSVDYPRIASASAIVSFINFAQVLATLLLVALLVATFVQHAKAN